MSADGGVAPAQLAETAPTPGLARNVAANVIGRGVSGLMLLAVTPVYLRVLGPEAYGLAGLVTTFKTLAVAFDLGLATTLNRELARVTDRSGSADAMRNLVRSIEACYWVFAAAVGLLCLAIAPVAARQWLEAPGLGQPAVEEGIALIGVVLALELPFTLYHGALLGLQRQVAANVLQAGSLAVRFGGAALVLVAGAPTIRAFFLWQAATAAGATVVAAALVWRSLPAGARRPRVSWRELRRVRRFAAGLALVTATGVAVMHVDKLIVARLLPLDQLGYYTVATTLAAVIYNLSSAVFAAVFPRLTRAVADGVQEELAEQYHAACQLASVVVMPVAAVLTAWAPTVVLLWTRDPAATDQTRWLVPLLVMTAAANALVTVPYALLLAFAHLRLTLAMQVAGILLLTPTSVLLTMQAGAIGAASGWALYTLAGLALGIRLVHRRFLAGELAAWYRRDVGPPLLAAFAMAFGARALLPTPESPLASIVLLACVGLMTLAATAAASPWVRHRLFRAGRALL